MAADEWGEGRYTRGAAVAVAAMEWWIVIAVLPAPKYDEGGARRSKIGCNDMKIKNLFLLKNCD